ncbi:MAG: EF-hand domain-containing protein [Polaribacter sp.]
MKNIENLMENKFTSPEQAFAYYDSDNDGFLSKNNFKRLLKEARVFPFIRDLVAAFVLQNFDKDKDGLVSWSEFQEAIKETKFN